MSHRHPSSLRRNERKSRAARKQTALRNKSIQAKRSLQHETLERRELLAAEIMHASFVPGTTDAEIEQWEEQNSAGHAQAGNVGASTNDRWRTTASGVSPNQGDSSIVTWSIVPDGTVVSGLAANEQSDLVAFMDSIYGVGNGISTDPVASRPWFGLFQNVFDAWEDVSGIDFEYEASDDGVAQGANGPGELGVRGDIRIGGGDGSAAPSVLAFAFGPANGGGFGLDGDIVVDTANGFYAANQDGPTGPNRGFHNVMTHEVGHAIGLGHVAPNLAGNILMEPTISLAFRGPQHDDILGVHTLYGDRFGDNDIQANAASPSDTPPTVLGPTRIVIDNVSIDEDADVDWYTFDATAGQLLSLSVLPIGETYDLGEDGGAINSVNTALNSDLRFELYSPTGALVASQSSNAVGEPEFIFSVPLAESGSYSVGVFGQSSLGPASGVSTPTQLYTLNISESSTGDPFLLAVAANAGDLFDLDPQDQATANVRDRAPTELVLTFGGIDQIDPSTLAGAVSVEFSESGNFALDAVPVEIGFIGLDDAQRNATLRFAENLGDGFYQLSITSALTSVTPLPFSPNFPQPVPGDSTLVREVITFEIELGGKVTSVIPQPIENGVPRPDQIDVYFDDDDLFRPGSTIGMTTFYQLIDTQNTATTEDDAPVNPTSVTIDAANRKVTLFFGANLDTFVDAGDSLRLRVGDATPFATLNVTPHVVATDPGLTSGSANLIPAAATGSWSVTLSEEIRNVGGQPSVDNPGSTNEPGHRDIEVEDHLFFPRDRDFDTAITTMPYTFLRNTPYAVNSSGTPLFNQMSAEQEQRFLEILDIYSDLLGIQFFETETDGLTLIVGDLATADPTVVSGPGGVAGLAGPGLSRGPGSVTIDAQDFTTPASQAFGQGFFDVALHEVGHAIGLGHSYDLPAGTVQGSSGSYPDSTRTVNEPLVEWAFPGDNDILHGLLLWQNESLDVDLYQINIAEVGELEVQAIAQRLADASLLDTSLTLYRQSGTGTLELVSSNDDYFGSDSYIQYSVTPGTYFVGVASQGNTSFDPESGVPSPGGTSEGDYDLRVDFKTETAAVMEDADGSILDGDRDGSTGGNYDFWFEPSAPNTIYVNKQGGSGGAALGSLSNPFTNIPSALAAAEAAMAGGSEGVVVRLLPNGGADGDVTTTGDNIAYEIGIVSSINQTLADGRNLTLPGGIQLVVDAGVIMKFLDSRISVGSDDDGFDRSESTISVQGRPDLPVYFTSFNDKVLGANSNALNTPVASGDWGGIEIRNDVDRAQGRLDVERLGIFQNYINHANMQYGGGEVSTINRVIDPVHLSQARAEVSYNTITLSSDAALSADPNTFEVTTFTESRFQSESVSGTGFIADYERIGPALYGNTLVDNSTNGIFVRIDTPPGGGLETLSVSARFDDTDIVHSLNENLIIQGAPGDGIEYSSRPAPIIGVTPVAGGSLPTGNYSYSYTFVDQQGRETPASTPQALTSVPASNQVNLTNIPVATGTFVGRRIYRSFNGGPFRLVAELDKTSLDHTDNVATPSSSAATLNVNDTAVIHGKVAGSLVLDPGTILKSQGARIELGFGANLIAEGLPGKEIIFTSRNDDEYGAGGTFDTNGNGSNSTAAARDWGGIYASPNSRVSIDRSLIAYAGGITGAGGGTAAFNPIQIHQADARIANSVLRDNGDGQGGGQLNSRNGFAPNADATIYVTAAQPTIVGNLFFDNAGAAININTNALNAEFNSDLGRQTGDVDLYETPPANTGAVIRGNQMTGNEINGMVVRGEVLTTEVVWDDTDIVHVLRNDIEIPDLHTYGGMRIESSASESLVVKFDGAEILATGRSLDITDRIGGRLHVLGTPGFPVILTSINDDTVGATFAPDGSAQTQTLDEGTGPNTPAAGDWQGLTFDSYSYDRNVAVVTEREGALGGFGDLNAAIGGHQELGFLAPNEKSGDETVRLGYTVHGAIAADNDQDVYSFEGTAGTMIWVDIDETDSKLDTVLEILDGDGRVLALSQDSRTESNSGSLTYTDTAVMRDGHALPMQLDHNAPTNITGEYRDLYTTNDGDSAMRVVLPGTTGSVRTYFVRVRSNNPSFNLTSSAGIDASLATGGATQGGYRMQIRLQEVDDFGGSVVRYADIRYATIAINAIGLPAHSSIGGELFNSGGSVDLGTFANTDRGALSATGDAGTVDTYTFNVGRDSLQGINPTDNSQGLVFDIDYADGLTRPNTNLYLYDGNTLIAIGTDSNIADDRITPIVPGQPTTETDLSRGTFGARDPFIGPLELSPSGDYSIVVANDTLMAADLTQFTQQNPANPGARLEPIDSAIRVIDDRFDFDPDDTTPTGDAQDVPFALQVGFEEDGSNIIPWQFGDIPFVTVAIAGADDGDVSQLNIFNPFTGTHDAVVDEDTTPVGAAAQSPLNIRLAIERPVGGMTATLTDDNTNDIYSISSDGVLTDVGDTGIDTFEYWNNGDTNADTNSTRPADNGDTAPGIVNPEGFLFRSLAFYNSPTTDSTFLYGLGERNLFQGVNVGSDANGNDIVSVVPTNVAAPNVIYLLDPNTGTAISRNGISMRSGFEAANPQDPRLQNDAGFNIPPEAPWTGTDIIAQVDVPATHGNVNSIVTDVAGDNFLYAFTDNGSVWQFDINRTGAGNEYGPGDLEIPTDITGAIDPNELIIDTTVGQAIVDTAGNTLIFDQVTKGPRNFDDGNTTGISDLYFGVQSGTGRLYGFTLGPGGGVAQPIFEFGADNIRLQQANDGTGIAGLFFNSLDTNLWHNSIANPTTAHGLEALDDRADVIGGGSLRFGFDPLTNEFNHLRDADENNLDADDLQNFSGYNFFGGAHGSIQSNTLDLSGFSNDDLPTLYFNYVLDTENVNAQATDDTNFNDGGLDNVMRDSLRVYVAGDDGDWALVASNNFADGLNNRVWDDSRDDDATGNNHEYEPGESGYTSVQQQIFVQELFDDNEFRQARIDLGPWAGNEEVQIRFEFTTAGEMRPDQSEIYAKDADQLTDAQTFTVSGNMPDPTFSMQGSVLPNRTLNFEIDLGLVARMPAGSNVTAPISLVRPNGTTVIELIPGGAAGLGQVSVLATDTAEDVAAKVAAAVGGQRSAAHPDWVGFPAEATAGNYSFGTLGTAYVISEPGVAGANIPVEVDLTMTATQVRDEIQDVLADQIHYQDTGKSLAAFPIVEGTNGVRIYDLTVTQAAVTPLGLLTGEKTGGTDTLPGTRFGVYTTGNSLTELLRAGERTRGNGGAQGVFLDDIVIGLAERGESLTNSTQGTALVNNPYFEALFFDAFQTGTVRPVFVETVDGTYQLETRLGREYLGTDNEGKVDLDLAGNPDPATENRIGSIPSELIGQTITEGWLLNERAAGAFNALINSNGSEILDGETFELSNGFETIRFEFNDVSVATLATPVASTNVAVNYTSAFSDGEVAQSVRDAINSASVRSVLAIEATSAGGLLTDSTDPMIFFHGYAAADHNGSSTFASPHLTGIVSGQDLVLGEDRGDRNLSRDQGQFIVDSNVISFSADTAVRLTAGTLAPGVKVPDEAEQPKPGAVLSLPTLNANLSQGNDPGTLHGAVVQNNLLIQNTIGISVANPELGDGTSEFGNPFIFTRIVNNTISQSATAGIQALGRVSPTILNNALNTNGVGIQSLGTANVVIRGTVYNGHNGNETFPRGQVGTEAIIDPAGPLFVNPVSTEFNLAAGSPNFYPAPGSALIDIGIDSQQDRPALVAVKDSVGIPQSPILVTETDLAGQIRRDGGPNSGQGQNVNIDVGALDRSDTTGPEAQIIVPVDNDAFNVDIDPIDTFLHLTEGTYSFFEFLISEGSGIGPDSSTITPDQLTIEENGRQLFPGRDVVIGYNASNRTLRFRPLSGTWRNDAVYEVIMQNQTVTLGDGTVVSGVADLAGNLLQPNRADGQTRFTIVMPGVDLDFGDAPATYDTTYAQDGGRHAVINFGNPRLGRYVDGEVDSAGVGLDDTVATVTAVGNVQDTTSNGPFTITSTGGVTTINLTSAPNAGDNIQINADGRLITFELVTLGGTVSVGRIPVEYASTATLAEITTALNNTLAATLPTQNVLVNATLAGPTQIELRGADDEDGAAIGSLNIGGMTIDGLFLDPDTGAIISYLNPLAPGGAELFIDTIGGGVLDVWIDYSGDGDFLEADERVLTSHPVSHGRNSIILTAPAMPGVLSNGTGTTWARFRLSEGGSPSHDGLVVGGEVEDYQVFIAAAPLPEPTDDNFGMTEGLFEDNGFSLTAANSVGANDTLNGASNIVFTREDDVDNGTLTFGADGSFSYSPAPDFYGTDTFTYRLTGTQMVNVGGTMVELPVRSSRAGTVTLSVDAVNDPPTAINHSGITTEPSDTNTATSLTFTSADLLTGALPHVNVAGLAAPFSEIEQNLKVSQVSVTDSSGTLAPLVPAASMLDPTTPADGTYSLDSHLSDGAGGFVQTGNVTITVAGGEITTVVYQPAADYNEFNPQTPGAVPSVDQFVYTVADSGATTLGDGNLAPVQPAPETVDATVSIQVKAQNDLPTAQDDTISTGIMEDVAFVIPAATLLANDFAGQNTSDDESQAVNGHDAPVTLVTSQGSVLTTNIGPTNSGIAVDDLATGAGYIMFSQQDVFSRFAAAPPLNAPGATNSDHLIAVRHNGFSWEYNNDTSWVPFTEDPSDRLLAQVNFNFDTITSLQYATGTISGIEIGFVDSDLTFNANQFNSQVDDGDFEVTGTFFSVSNDPEFPTGFRAYPLTTEQGGTVSFDPISGNLTYQAAQDYYGPDSFTYFIADSGQNFATDGSSTTQVKYDFATVSLTVAPVNDAPGARDQGFTTREDTALTISAAELLAGSVGHATPVLGVPFDESNQDSTTTVVALDIGGTAVTAANAASVPFTTANGTVTAVNFDASGNLVDLTYMPNLDFNADNPRTGGSRTLDSIGFTVSDDGIAILPPPSGASVMTTPETDQAIAFIFVTPQNDAPIAGNDLIVGNDPTWNAFSGAVPLENTTLQIPAAFLLNNDVNAPSTAADETGLINDIANLSIVPQTFTTALGGTVTLFGNGDLSYRAPDGFYGVDTFEYTIADQGIDEDLNGTRLVNSLSHVGTVTIQIEPVNDPPQSFDRSLTGVEDSMISFTAADLLTTTPAAQGTNVDPLPPAPYDESEQVLRVVAFSDGDESIDVNDLIDPAVGNDGDGTLTMTTVSGGTLTFNFMDGAFVDGTYVPGDDYNQRTPFASVELFSYVIADDGMATIPGSGAVNGTGIDTVLDLADLRSAPANVELTVTHVNDPPSFTNLSLVEILERDDSSETVISGWASNVLPGPITALDEHQRESVVFTYLPSMSSVTPGLFFQDPSINSQGALSLFPNPDQIGTATIVVRVEDSDNLTPGFVPQTQLVTFTVNVQPKNDAPRIIPSIAGTAASNSADEAYSIANDGTITFTLPEDNTSTGGVTSPFLINLRTPTNAGYSPIGLLDVFEVGPPNEISNDLGGSQVLSLSNFSTQTDLGGSLVAVTDAGGAVIGLEYTPPADYNNSIGIADSFTYVVIDDSTTGGETYSLFSSQLEDDQLTATNQVRLNLTPVNDAPVVQYSTSQIQVSEDAGPQAIAGFAFNFAAGPTATATDETGFVGGQATTFDLSPVNFSAGQLGTLFTSAPAVSSTGVLSYEAAPDVFGDFEFEVTLTDNGADDPTRGDINTSNPETLTINVRPVNDPPQIVTPGSLVFDVRENGSLSITADGTGGTTDLLSAYAVGPANEAANVTPGGNQTLNLGTVPLTTTAGGTLTPVLDASNVVTGYTYAPPTDFVGQDSFVYQVNDNGDTVLVTSNGVASPDPQSTQSTVVINVTPVNNAPVFSGGEDVIILEDAGLISIQNWATAVLPGPLTALDEVSGATAQTVTASLSQTSGSTSLFSVAPTVTLNGTSITLSFETAPNQSGNAGFDLVLVDDGPIPAPGNNHQNTTIHPFQIVIGLDNDPPTFTAGPTITIQEDSGAFTGAWATSLSAGPGAEATTQTIDRFELTIPADATGLFSVLPTIDASTGDVSFTPALNANGVVDISVVAVDNLAAKSSPPATLTIDITPTDDSPTANDDRINANEDQELRIEQSDLLANDTDPDSVFDPNEILSVTNVQLTSSLNASITLDPLTGDIIYNPAGSTQLQALAPNQSLTDQFTYSIQDADGESPEPTATVTLTISGINDEPTLLPDSATVVPGSSVDIPVLDNDTDVDNAIDPASIIITSQPINGSVINQASGIVTYIAEEGFTGSDSFRYTVADVLGQQSEETTVTIGVNFFPQAAPDLVGGVANDGVVSVNVLDNDQGDLVFSTLVIETQPQNGTVTIILDASGVPTGELQYTPTTAFTGTDSFTYSIADSLGRRSSPGTVTVQYVASGRQNPVMFTDVTANGETTPLDALRIINRLALEGSSFSIPASDRGPDFWDVNGSLTITPLDVLLVLNELAGTGGSGEQIAPLVDFVQTDAIEIGTNLNRNGSQFEPVMPEQLLPVEDATDQILAASSIAADPDATVLDMIVDDSDTNEDELSALDDVLTELF